MGLRYRGIDLFKEGLADEPVIMGKGCAIHLPHW